MHTNKLSVFVYATLISASALLPYWYFSSRATNYELKKIDIKSIGILGTESDEWRSEFTKSPIPHLTLIYKKNEKNVRFLFSTIDAGVACHGYKNIVELLVLTDIHGKVINIALGKNIESEQIVAKIANNGFLKFWDGKNSYSGHPVAVTGATFTCKSINDSLKKLFDELKAKNFFENSHATYSKYMFLSSQQTIAAEIN